mmetsp:Transcript_36476/g.81199  ORF Transcript_36476/g.81199 Transcript_36476/m.81199 type:complete len:203 (-) Transcript_36476:601-1209(-)
MLAPRPSGPPLPSCASGPGAAPGPSAPPAARRLSSFIADAKGSLYFSRRSQARCTASRTDRSLTRRGPCMPSLSLSAEWRLGPSVEREGSLEAVSIPGMSVAMVDLSRGCSCGCRSARGASSQRASSRAPAVSLLCSSCAYWQRLRSNSSAGCSSKKDGSTPQMCCIKRVTSPSLTRSCSRARASCVMCWVDEDRVDGVGRE